MMRIVVAACVAGTALPATAAAAELTPDGAATLTNRYTGASTLEGRPPEVLTAARVTVGEGGRAGTIRLSAAMGLPATPVLSEPVNVPAEPGVYTFPMPHMVWDYRGGRLGLEQTTGGHAIVTQRACAPEVGEYGDPCQVYWVDGYDSGPRGGAELAIVGVTEVDRDRDLRGDSTEDRTDLGLKLDPRRDPDGRMRVGVTVTNAGPLPADLPLLETSALPSGRFLSGCLPSATFPRCALAPLAAGESRTLTLVSDDPNAVTALMKVSAEGPDLAPTDNGTGFIFGRAPAFTVLADKQQSLRSGVKVQASGVRAGRARVTVAFKLAGGKTVKVARVVTLKPYAARSVTVKATGAKLRSLRRAAKQGPLSAEISVRTFSGKTPVTAKVTVRR